MTDLPNMRKEYNYRSLNKKDLLPDPIQQFRSWFADAVHNISENPNVMYLSTATQDGKASSRIVLLKNFDERGFVFFTNYDSRKGREIEFNPYASLLFFWQSLERQVRIEGKLVKISSVESDEYFKKRPEESQIAAWASPQSNIIPDRDFLDKNVKKYKNQFHQTELKRPSNWGGYRLIPEKTEFWQGRENRLHDRFLYNYKNKTWVINRLAP